MMLVAVQVDGTDRFPVFLKDDCERTCCDSLGNSESLLQLTLRLGAKGYVLMTLEDAHQRYGKILNNN